jgi:hypothetical protein
MERTDNHRARRPKTKKSLLVLAVVTLVLAVGAVSANAASSIVGVWSFNGGDIAIQPDTAAGMEGTFVGTVVTETKFSECTHPPDQQIWTDIRMQADGEFWGLHQWYFQGPECALNPSLGPTAWRVMEEPSGTRFLRVCLSSPGTTQPVISAEGSPTDATYGCVSSALATSAAASFKLVSLPSSKQCLSLRHFKIHIRDPRHDAFKTVTITLRGHRLATVRHGNFTVATVNLRGLRRGAFTVKIRATTVLGHHISGSRTFHTCIARIVKHPAKKTTKKTTGKG